MFDSLRQPLGDSASSTQAKEFVRAVMEYFGATDPNRAGRILQLHPILLSEEALAFVDGLIVLGRREGTAAVRGLLGSWERLRDLLDDALKDGIPAATAHAQLHGEHDFALVFEYFSLPTLAVRHFVERQRSTLLDTDLMDRMRATLPILRKDAGAATSALIDLRIQFLSDARTEGIEAAWSDFLARVANWFARHGDHPEDTEREE